MKVTTILAVSAAYLAAGAVAATATTSMGVEQPSSKPIYKQPVVQGCFSSQGSLVYNSSQPFNSRGQCGQTVCQAAGYDVAASSAGSDCFCGDTYPPLDTLVDDSKCDSPCTGYGQDACGGDGFWTVYNTGLELYGVKYDENTTTSASSSSTAGVTTSTSTSSSGQTVFVTQTSSSTPSAESKKKSTNTAGIAAGVVVGVVCVAGVVGGILFYMRRRRNKEIEDEHRRNAAVNSFFGKPPGSSGGLSNSDARLDPVMAQRRMSSGSIADNQDYSRKILRVTNA